jgi:hypothetical protein
MKVSHSSKKKKRVAAAIFWQAISVSGLLGAWRRKNTLDVSLQLVNQKVL